MPIPSRSRQISYRLYTMDRDGHIVDVRPFEAAGDLAAMVAADTGGAEVLELWCGDRRVTEFPTEQARSGGRYSSGGRYIWSKRPLTGQRRV